MTINYTTLLGLAKPVTGTESGVWGDVVNNQITSLLEDAIANSATINVTSANVTLTDNNGAADQARMAILLVTGTPGTTRNIVAPSTSKWYIVRNGSNADVVIKGAATTGVTIPTGSDALVFWNGSDFEVGAVAGPASSTDNAVVRYDGTTGKVVQNSSVTIDDSNNVGGLANLNFSGTSNRITGDFSNATLANRVMLQSSTTNGATVVGVIPNGTSTDAALSVYNASPATNAAGGTIYANSVDFRISSDKYGTGSYLPMTFYTGGSERVRIDTSGNVLVGTTGGSVSTLTVSAADGAAPANGTGSNALRLRSTASAAIGAGPSLLFEGQTGNTTAQYAFAAIQGFKGSSSANNYSGVLAFYTQNSGGSAALDERMRIDSSGNLLVGTTNAQAQITSVAGSGNAGRFYNGYSNLGNPAVLIDKQDNNSTTSNVFVQFTINSQATGCGQINANGANTAAFGSFSDVRLKENITDLPSQLANILSLRPVEFDYIQSEGGGHQIGFIAQEMEKVYPDVVGERSDGMKTITAWSKTEARLVKAIQEQQALIEQLTQRIAALEGA